jgi:outer membrane protein assembly factor BamB
MIDLLRKTSLSLFSLAATLTFPCFCPAEDWPEFRGPTGQGLASGDKWPVHWNSKENVVWKVPIPGEGWSSPIVADGRVYLTTSLNPESAGSLSLQVLCLDAGTGKLIWQKEVFRKEDAAKLSKHSKNSHASSTPLIHGGKLFAHFGSLGTACLDLSGTILWQNKELAYSPVHGNGGSPAYVDGVLVLNCDGGDKAFVAGLDTENGKVLWTTPRTANAVKKFSFSTPLAITAGGRTQVISPGSDAVCAYEPKTGQEIWQVEYDGYSVVPRPVFGHGLIFVSSGFDAPSLLAVRPDGKGDVSATHVVWRTKLSVSLTPSFLLAGDELYMVTDNGIATCLDARTGNVHWRERVGGSYSASPLFAAGNIYFQSEQGTGVVVKAGKAFEVVAKNPLGERTLASYAAADGAFFIRTEKHLYKIR